jgi:hypothetical protein
MIRVNLFFAFRLVHLARTPFPANFVSKLLDFRGKSGRHPLRIRGGRASAKRGRNA